MANTRTPKNPTLAEIAAVTKPIEKVVPLCVDGSLFAEHERLNDQLDDAFAASTSSRSRKLNGSEDADPEVEQLAKQVKAVEAKMAKHTFEFRFRKLPGNEWDDLIAAHPPRDDDQADRNAGIDRSAFPKAAVQATCVDPDVSDTAVFDKFWADLNTGQRTLLYVDGARAVNQMGASVPKSDIASAVMARSRRNSASVSA